MSSKDAALYGKKKQRNLGDGKEIASATTLAFTSQLSSLINTSKTEPTNSKSGPARARPKKKDDIFSSHNRNVAKRAKRDLDIDNAATATQQKHTTDGEALDPDIWARSKRKMEEKARIYAAMKRGDIEDTDERYAVDFDQKWADARAQGKDLDNEDTSSDDPNSDDDAEQVEYVDEFGRTRTGTRKAAERAKYAAQRASRADRGAEQHEDDGTSARPIIAPTGVIYGDTIQHQAFDPDAPRAAQMAALAAKRDRSLTPPPESHFDATQEVRTKGTGFFQFSGDAEERKRQMEGLERGRAETEQRRKERDGRLEERKRMLEERRLELAKRNAKRKADAFLEDLGKEIGVTHEHDGEGKDGGDAVEEEMVDETHHTGTDLTARIEAAINAETDDV